MVASVILPTIPYFHILPIECGCSKSGSLEHICDDAIGKCACKPGFKGDKCEICPDGLVLILNEDGTSANDCHSGNNNGIILRCLPINL